MKNFTAWLRWNLRGRPYFLVQCDCWVHDGMLVSMPDYKVTAFLRGKPA